MSEVLHAVAIDADIAAADRLQLARRRHWTALAVCVGVFIISLALQVLPNGRIALQGFTNYPLPHSCFARIVGFSCPVCGLTRSFIHLAHGDWAAAHAAHRLGWLVASLVCGQIPYRLWVLRRIAAGELAGLSVIWTTRINCALLLLLCFNWLAIHLR